MGVIRNIQDKVFSRTLNKALAELQPMEGLTCIEKYSNNGRVKRTIKKNTITDAGKHLFLEAGPNKYLMGMSSIPYGRLTSFQPMITPYTTSSSPTYVGDKYNQLGRLTVNLLNLGGTVASTAKFVDVYTDALLVDETKRIGYGDNTNSTASTKLGLVDYCKGTYMINPSIVSFRWLFKPGVATGTFDNIAIAPHFDDLRAFMTFKCITRLNVQDATFAFNNGYVMPNVTGITGANEILLNHNNGGILRWKYNISTGEMTEVPSTETLVYNFPMYANCTQQIFDSTNGYLYVLSNSTLYKINVTTGTVTDTEITYNSASGMYINSSGKLIVTSAYSDYTLADTSSNNAARYQIMTITGTTISVDSFGYMRNLTELGGLPSGWYKNNTTVRKTNGFFYVMNVVTGQVLKCTDLADVDTTTVEVTFIGENTVYPWRTTICNNGTNTWFIHQGDNGLQHYLYANSVLTEYDWAGDGIYISQEDYSNVISNAHLDSPEVKGDTDQMYVSYYYKVV